MKLQYILDHMPADIKRQTTHKVYLPGESIVRKGEEAGSEACLSADKGRNPCQQ